jgi:hypothetical protein
MVLVLLVMILPGIVGAVEPVCWVDQCGLSCPSSSFDCSQLWMYETWENYCFAMMLIAAGYNFLACCLP